MPMEIRPIPGQPGLFRQGLSRAPMLRPTARWASTTSDPKAPYAGPMGDLSAARWASTSFTGPMFHPPFGGRLKRGRGLEAIALPPAFITAPGPEHLSQEDIPVNQTPGLTFKLILFTPGPLVPQDALDQAFRSLLGQQGFDVSSSQLGAQPITFRWEYTGADKSWSAVIATGPREVVGLGGWKVVYDPPTVQDLQGLPQTAESWSVTARPKDGVITPAKITKLIEASRAARTAVAKQFNVEIELYIHVHGVAPASPQPLTAGIGGVIAMIGVGWLSYLALRGKSVVETR